MKKIVNGRLFDTQEAIVVCSWREMSMVFGVDIEARFELCREKVAEKPTDGLKLSSWGDVLDSDVEKDESKGDFFLAMWVGGPCGPCRIRPLDVDEARRVFEAHTDSDYNLEDKYQKYFGVRPRKSDLEMVKEAFKAGAEAKKRQYEEEEAKKAEAKKNEAETF